MRTTSELKRSVRSLLKRVAASPAFCAYEAAWFRRIPSSPELKREGVLLITTNGGGNIGDQAMFEAFVQNSTKLVIAVVPKVGALQVPDHLAGQVQVHVLDGLFSGRPQLTPRNVRTFGHLLRRSEALAIVGADIADGSYDFREAWVRVQALRAAVKQEIPAKVLGFSWSEKPHPRITDAYRSLGPQVELLIRDKYSLGRLQGAGVAGGRLVADMVFALDGWQAEQRAAEMEDDRPTVLLNVSGLLRNRYSLEQEYVSIIEFLQERGYRVLLLPHVIRAGDDDQAAGHALIQLCGISGVSSFERMLTPSEVQAAVSAAHLVITGRMHLGILALTVGCPAIVIGSQGKVEGMLAHFDLERFAITPGAGMGLRALELLQPELDLLEHARSQIQAHRDGVVELARTNFS